MIKRGPEDLQNIPWQSREPLGGDVGPGWDLSARLFVIIIPLSPGNGAGAQIPRKQRAQRARNETGRVLGWVKGRILLPRSAQGGMSSPQGQRGHQKKKKPLPKFPAKVISWLEIHPSPLCLNLYLPLGLDLILFLFSMVRSP